MEHFRFRHLMLQWRTETYPMANKFYPLKFIASLGLTIFIY